MRKKQKNVLITVKPFIQPNMQCLSEIISTWNTCLGEREEEATERKKTLSPPTDFPSLLSNGENVLQEVTRWTKEMAQEAKTLLPSPTT